MQFKPLWLRLGNARWMVAFVITALIALALTLSIFAVQSYMEWNQAREYWNQAHRDWNQARESYERHVQSGAHAICERIRIEECRGRDRGAFYAYLMCVHSLSQQRGISCDVRDPGPDPGVPALFFLSSLQQHLDVFFAIAAVLWLVPMGIFMLAKLYTNEPNLGYRRLAILCAPTFVALAMLYLWILDGWVSEGTLIAALLLASLAGFAAPLVARRVIGWLLEGFRGPAGPPKMVPASVVEDHKASPERVKSRGLRIFFWSMGAFFVALGLFVMNPEGVLEALIAAIVASIGVVVVVYISRVLYMAYLYWWGK